MPAQLQTLGEGPSILLDKPILLLGRHPECDIQIDSRKVSRRHCCIAQVEDYLVVRDLGSTNGVRINGVRVLEGRLRPDDELTIGNLRYRVRWDEPGDRRAPDDLKAREPAAGVPVDGDDDEVLESCDEPVPLREPPAPGPAPRAVSDDPSLVLPAELNLAPLSDANSPPPSSHSH